MTKNVELTNILNSNFQLVRKFLCCETKEQCEEIQKGSLLLKRISKLSVLFSIGISLFISDIINFLLDKTNSLLIDFQKMEEITSTCIYKWTFGLFLETPNTGSSKANDIKTLIEILKFVDFIQFLLFISIVALSIRWVYADSRVNQNARLEFKSIMVIAAITNSVIYYCLQLLFQSLINNVR